MSFQQCTAMFVKLNVLCLGNLGFTRRSVKSAGKFLYFPPYTVIPPYTAIKFSEIVHPTLLFRPTQLLIWMNFPPFTIIPHCTAIRHFTVVDNPVSFKPRQGPQRVIKVLRNAVGGGWASCQLFQKKSLRGGGGGWVSIFQEKCL